MAEDLGKLTPCPNPRTKCGRPVMLRRTTGGLVYSKCQGFHSDDGSHCGFSFQYGRKDSAAIIAEIAKAARKPDPEPKETDSGKETTEPGRADPAGNDDGGGGIFRRGRR